jgi:hypothetical protein
MITFRCRTCGQEGELVFGSSEGWFWCDESCAQEFANVVDHLAKGGDPGEIDVEPDSRLYSEAFKEVAARRRAERVYIRDVRQAEYARTKPRPFRALYPC